MKKLIMAAAIVCAAVAAQADAYFTNWPVTGSGIKDYAGNAYSGEVDILVDGACVSWAEAKDGAFSVYATSYMPFGSHKITLTFKDGDRTYSEEVWGESVESYVFEGDHNGDGSEIVFNGTGTWTGGPSTENVPEPTSGLLMLIGMGALALKRKRA